MAEVGLPVPFSRSGEVGSDRLDLLSPSSACPSHTGGDNKTVKCNPIGVVGSSFQEVERESAMEY